MTTWPLQSACPTFYGVPGTAAWEAANLVSIPAPWTLYYDGKKTSGMRVHRKCADSLKRVLNAIWEACGRSQAEIDRIGMSNWGGGYNYRPMRTGSSLSMHSYGCAVDFDPARNGLGNRNPKMDPLVIRAFEAEGWEWGGHWSNPDGMHFQAAWTKASPARLPPPSPSAPKPARPLTLRGHLGPHVEYLQQRLNALGASPKLREDGDFGDLTQKAVEAFQRSRKLMVDGKVGPATWAALE